MEVEEKKELELFTTSLVKDLLSGSNKITTNKAHVDGAGDMHGLRWRHGYDKGYTFGSML